MTYMVDLRFWMVSVNGLEWTDVNLFDCEQILGLTIFQYEHAVLFQLVVQDISYQIPKFYICWHWFLIALDDL